MTFTNNPIKVGLNMYDLKAFMSMPNLSDNKLGKTNTFGELTTQAKTYTRDMREYSLTKYPDVQLYVFKAIDEMALRVEPTSTFMDTLLAIGQWVYTQHQSKLIPLERNRNAFIAALGQQFPSISGIVIGELLKGSSPDKNMPDFIQFKMLDGTRQYQPVIWFSDKAFKEQYPEHEIFLIPPLPDIADLIDGKVAVNNKITGLPQSRLVNAIQDIRQDKPETALHSYELTWHDPSDTNAILKTTWTAVIYGNGNDTELVKDAIRDYIDNNSDYDKWAEIYPDLYSENEFIIIPDWSNVAVPNNAMDAGLYRSIINMNDITDKLTKFLPSGYTTPKNKHVTSNMLIGSAYYRTVMFGAIGSPNNRNKVFDLRTIFPDYMAVDTQDVDFVRMSSITQTWVQQLNECLDKAHSYKPTDILPSGFVRVIRRGHHFITFNFDGYNYVVLTKYSFDRAG